jgi:(p)ppGpp synthase/HD superfamily hydrolase
MPRRPRSTDDVGVSVTGAPGVLTKLAKCCTPVPGDQIMGFVTRVLADEKVNILSASVTTSGDRVAISRFTFETGDPKHLGHLLDVVRNVEGVYDVYVERSAAINPAAPR